MESVHKHALGVYVLRLRWFRLSIYRNVVYNKDQELRGLGLIPCFIFSDIWASDNT